MITCDTYLVGSRKWAICNGTIDWPLEKINAFRKQHGAEPLLEKPESAFKQPEHKPVRRLATTPMAGHSRPDSSSSIQRIKQPGTRLKEEFAKWNAEECPICSGMASQMDAGGAKYCRENLTKIVADITERGKEWFAKHFPKADTLFAISRSQIVRDLVIKLMVKKLVTKAITETESEEAASKKKSRGRRDPAAAAGRYFESLKKEQKRLLTDHAKNAKPQPDRFNGTPVLHFGAHLWPVKDHWHWHVDLWNSLVERINGKMIVFVAIDKNTVSFDEVRKRLNPAIEAIESRNTPEGENPSFRKLQELIPSGHNDVLLYCHGKGVQDRTYRSEAVRLWTEAMYETVVFHHAEITHRLEEGYRVFCSFRMFGSILGNRHRWHPSGTFFAVRAKHLQGKPVRAGYGGVEAWCGDHFPASEAWCETGDGIIFTDLYDLAGFKARIQPLLDEWRRKNIVMSNKRQMIAVTTCNLHGSEEIRKDIAVVLDSIALHCSSDVLVVDDGSPKEYQEYVRTLCNQRGFRFVGIWNNGGISHAKNLCLSEFTEFYKCEYCFLLDDDVKVISDTFESTYTSAMDRTGVGILSWNDPEWVLSTSELDGELVASNHTCGCCVVVSRKCVQATGLYDQMPGKWGLEHIAYYKRAAIKFAKPGVYFDVPNSKSLLLIASHASVFTYDEKIKSCEMNRFFLETMASRFVEIETGRIGGVIGSHPEGGVRLLFDDGTDSGEQYLPWDQVLEQGK